VHKDQQAVPSWVRVMPADSRRMDGIQMLHSMLQGNGRPLSVASEACDAPLGGCCTKVTLNNSSQATPCRYESVHISSASELT
jgi:hypothetical protein